MLQGETVFGEGKSFSPLQFVPTFLSFHLLVFSTICLSSIFVCFICLLICVYYIVYFYLCLCYLSSYKCVLHCVFLSLSVCSFLSSFESVFNLVFLFFIFCSLCKYVCQFLCHSVCSYFCSAVFLFHSCTPSFFPEANCQVSATRKSFHSKKWEAHKMTSQ